MKGVYFTVQFDDFRTWNSNVKVLVFVEQVPRIGEIVFLTSKQKEVIENNLRREGKKRAMDISKFRYLRDLVSIDNYINVVNVIHNYATDRIWVILNDKRNDSKRES